MKIIDKIFGDKKSTPVIYIVLAVGILMIVCANSFKNTVPYQKTDQSSAQEWSLQTETERILSEIEGVGEVSVMISGEEKQIHSVLVVAEGGAIPEVKEKIVRALKAALCVDAHKIEVFERKEKQ